MSTLRTLALACLVALLGGCYEAAFHCDDPTDCGGGRCELATMSCSFVDEDCAEGYRYGEHSGGLSGECVGEADAGVPDAMPPDAMLSCGSSSGCSCLSTIVAGGWHTCATNATGEIYCWGRDFEGQVGDGGTCDGAAMSPSVETPVMIGTGMAVAAGRQHGCHLDSAMNVRCWGDNDRFQAGCDLSGNVCAPTAVTVPSSMNTQIALGVAHSCVLSSSTINCWGQDNNGELGRGTASPSETCTATAVAIGGIPIDLAAGQSTTCSIHSSGTPQRLYCWGSNEFGQVGRDPTIGVGGCVMGGTAFPAGACGTPNEIIGAANFDEVAVGGGHVCTHTTLGDITCWGDNTDGAVGTGTLGPTHTPQLVMDFPGGSVTRPRLALGDDHSCTIVDVPSQPGTVFCWGDNQAGQLGLTAVGSTRSQLPVQVMRTASEPLSGVDSITAGARHTCAQSTDGTIWCWGDNSCGQLGDGLGGDCESDTLPAAIAVPQPVTPLLTCP